MFIQLSIIVPVYNSEKSLDELYVRITNILNFFYEDSYEILLIDDGSMDKSFLKMEALHEHDKRVKIIQLSKNFGQQNALMCGFHYAQGAYVVTLDDDLQHPPEEIKKLIDKLEEGYDVVFGIPIEKYHPFYRNFGTKIINMLLNIICKKPVHIKVSSFRAIRKNVVKKIIKDQTSFVYIAPMIFRITQKVENVFVRHAPRKYGISNYTLFKLIKIFIKLIFYYSISSKVLPVSPHPQFEVKNIKI